MKLIRSVFILFIGAFLFAAVFTPPVYSTLRSILGEAEPWPFSRVFNRVAMLGGMLLVLLLRRQLGLSELLAVIRASLSVEQLKLLLSGLSLSLIVGGSVLLFELNVLERLIWDETATGRAFGKTLMFLPAALFVSLIEEGFFRVLLLRALSAKFGIYFAATISSVLYALVHFISPVKSFFYGEFDALAGFTYLGSIFSRYAHFDVLMAAVGLVLLGLSLCYAICRYNSLLLCVGLHMGWIMLMKLVNHGAIFAPGVEVSAVIGKRYFLASEPIAWVAILGVWVVLAIGITRQPASRSENHAAELS